MNTQDSRRPGGIGKRIVFLVAGFAALTAGAGFFFYQMQKGTQQDTAAPANLDNTFQGENPLVFLNTSSEVKFVGDAKCAECHEKEAAAYQLHPMGQSLAPLAAATSKESFERENQNPFEVGGLRYLIEKKGEKMVHREQRLDAEGKLLFESSGDVAYVIGAGDHGRSYLIERNGYLSMSPITWYPQRAMWDLSPTYEINNLHFTRPVFPDCLFCHTNRALPIENTLNRYQAPAFDGHPIGCERCHGPGELHAKRYETGDFPVGLDDTIVNPSRLSPTLRNDVCDQCHLAGEARITRKDRDPYDYRPGLPWSEFMSIFLKQEKPGEPAAITGHVMQMHASRCFQAAGGQMSCISCHDPHKKPSPGEKVDFFRDRCLNCHAKQDCSAPKAQRQSTSPEDNCMQCHMPPVESKVRHAAITDHRIPRKKESPPPGIKKKIRGWPMSPFYHDDIDLQNAEFMRDLGIAIVKTVEYNPQLIQTSHIRAVLPALQTAADENKNDFDAWESLAHAQYLLGRDTAALATLEAVLEREPNREAFLDGAALTAAQLGDLEKAENYWTRAIAINPYNVRFHRGLASVAIQINNWSGGVESCRRVLRLEPTDFQTRQMLIECLLNLKQFDPAQKEFNLLLGAAPSTAATQLNRWFNSHPLRKGEPKKKEPDKK